MSKGKKPAPPTKAEIEERSKGRKPTPITEADYAHTWIDKRVAIITEMLESVGHPEPAEGHELSIFGGATEEDGGLESKRQDLETARQMLWMGSYSVDEQDLVGAMNAAFEAGKRSMRGYKDYVAEETSASTGSKGGKAGLEDRVGTRLNSRRRPLRGCTTFTIFGSGPNLRNRSLGKTSQHSRVRSHVSSENLS
jgi:hypothetical protein